jgi:hypothetical protein
MNPLQKLLDFIVKLEEHGIFYALTSVRSDAIMVEIPVPGERWEVEFFPDGQVEVEIFRGGSEIMGEEALERLFAMYAEDAEDAEAKAQP